MFIYDLYKLHPGDIILKRTAGDEISMRVMESTKSEYSHAMLYLGNSSYIDVGKRVQARNLQRYLFDNPDDTCILRLKRQYLTKYRIQCAVYYARDVVGSPYSIRDALRLESGLIGDYTENTQICTRLVAKAYEKSGVRIVDNIEMCTPQEILLSEKLERIEGCYRVASEHDIRFVKTYDVIDDMVETTDRLIESLYNYSNGAIRTMSQLTDYVLAHPDDDNDIAQLVEQSGYLYVLEKDEEYNSYNYDVDEFLKFYGTNSVIAAIQLLENNSQGLAFYENIYSLLFMEFLNNEHESSYINQMLDLYQRILEQHHKREHTAIKVLWNLNLLNNDRL